MQHTEQYVITINHPDMADAIETTALAPDTREHQALDTYDSLRTALRPRESIRLDRISTVTIARAVGRVLMAGVEPSGCRHCCVPEREHMQRWTTGVGWHQWVEPTQEQILARMNARANPPA